jgi:hypothetical protein
MTPEKIRRSRLVSLWSTIEEETAGFTPCGLCDFLKMVFIGGTQNSW